MSATLPDAEPGQTDGMTHRFGRGAVSITSLSGSRTDDIRRRERRYIQVMLFRLAAFIAAVLVFHGPARFIAIVLALVLPWLAVLVANQPVAHKAAPALHQPPPERPTPSLQPARSHQVIDQD